MAEFIEGTYMVISVISGLALDVVGAQDKSKVNVQQYTPQTEKMDGQIWAVTQYSNGWQFKNSLTNKVMDVDGAQFVTKRNVWQYDDTNSVAQRWAIVPDGGTYTYKSVSYDTYAIRPYSAQTLSLDVSGGGTTPGTNVQIYTNNSSDAQRWIFVPVPVFTDDGTYMICPAPQPNLVVGVSAGSTANKAKTVLQSVSDENHQIVRTEVDPETFNVFFHFVHSNYCLDVYGGNPTIVSGTAKGNDVVQYVPNQTVAQRWLPIKKENTTFLGETYPTYELAMVANNYWVLDCWGISKTSAASASSYVDDTAVKVGTRHGYGNQRFVFIKTEIFGNGISRPGDIDQKELSRVGAGDVTVSGLTFVSDETLYQARYKVLRYGSDRKTPLSDTGWLNFDDDSSSRFGWGDAWTPTFEAVPSEGRVTIPFTKTVSLDSTYQYAEFITEVRVYSDSYKYGEIEGYKAHGPIVRSTVKIVQIPEITVGSSSIFKNTETGKIGIKTTLSDSLGNGCSFLRGRISGEDGEAITEWQTTSSMTVEHLIDGQLLRFPYPEESLNFEYSMLTKDGVSFDGTIPFSIQYSGSSSITVEYLEDSLTAKVKSPSDPYEFSFVEVSNLGTKKFIENSVVETVGSQTVWKCVPPLNRDVKVIKIGSQDGQNWTYTESIVRIDSHLFVWNWTEIGASDKFERCAAIIINSDAPPAQTRRHTSDVKFSSPSGRVRPVAFASRTISTDISVKGVVVDEDASYYAVGPIPDSTKLGRIELLATLSGRGIHPIYRTPYGDWSQVAIEDVDVSKNDMNLSDATVTQRIVED